MRVISHDEVLNEPDTSVCIVMLSGARDDSLPHTSPVIKDEQNGVYDIGYTLLRSGYVCDHFIL